ncbi:MAG: glycosyltransferase [Candidatus Diapherotrites archaeon]
MKPEYSVIIPARNEEETIAPAIGALRKTLKGNYEIIVVNDSSADNTAGIVARLEGARRSIRLVHSEKRGFANALLRGIAASRSQAVVPVMADLCDRPEDVNLMFGKMAEGYGIVCASRYMKGGRRIGGSRAKAFFSWFVGLLFNRLIGVPTADSTNSFKMYRKDVLRKVLPKLLKGGSFSFSLEVTMLAYFSGFRITELPTVWRERSEGVSKFNVPNMAPEYFSVFLDALKRKLQVLAGGREA